MGDHELAEFGLGLDAAIQMVREDILKSERSEGASELGFPVESVTIEFQVVAMREGEGRAGFRIPVIDMELGGVAIWQRTTTHTVRVQFGPPATQGGRRPGVIYVGDETATEKK